MFSGAIMFDGRKVIGSMEIGCVADEETDMKKILLSVLLAAVLMLGLAGLRKHF